ncbi:alpha/beta fold hydrolase [Gemmatimonadota bacterium]
MKRTALIPLVPILAALVACGGDTGPLEVTTGFIEVGNGAELYYEEMGRGLPVVMIHGGFLTHRNWDDQFEVFAREGYRVVRYDARGHGRSLSIPGDFNHTEDLKIVLDELGIEKAVLMGLSMGGYISSDFAVTCPDRVAGLVLVSPGITGYDFSQAEDIRIHYEEFGEDYASRDPERIARAFMRAWTDGPYRTPEETPAEVRERSLRMCLESLNNTPDVESREVRPEPPAIERLAEISVPTLAILATLDMPVITAIVDLYERDIPDCRKIVIEDAAHAVNMEKPEEFNRAVLGFLRELGRQEPGTSGWSGEGDIPGRGE